MMLPSRSRFPTVRETARYLRSCFRIDTRSLAAFRIALGLLIVADMLLRARNFGFYYTDDGVVPAELAASHTADHAVSVYFLVSDPNAIAALFAFQTIVGLALAVGYRTRTVAVGSFLLVVSLDHHNPFVLSYADTLFRLLLFWAMFLPLGKRFSIDAVRSTKAARETVGGPIAALALLQMVFMYVVNGIHKLQSGLWKSGEAAALVFGIDEMTFLLGEFLRQYPALLQYGGLLWFYMLLFGWLLILLPGRFRVGFISLFIGGHASFALTVRIGAFAYVAIAGLLLFLPPIIWQDLDVITRRVGLDEIRGRIRSVARSIAFKFPAFRLIPPRYARALTAIRTTATVVVLLALALVVSIAAFNAGVAITDDDHDQQTLNDAVSSHPAGTYIHSNAERIGITQPEWSVFAPRPRTTDRYYVFGAQTTDGERLDVFNDRPFTLERPHDRALQRQHSTYRHRFFMNSVRRSDPQDELPANLGEHICRTYAERGVELESISIFEVTEGITRETINDPENRDTERTIVARYICDV